MAKIPVTTTPESGEILTDERVKELQEEWNPSQYDSEPEGFVKDMLIRVANRFHGMSVDEYRQVLIGRVEDDEQVDTS